MVGKILLSLALLTSMLLAPLYPNQSTADIQTPANPIVQNNWTVGWETNEFGLVINSVQYLGATSPYSTVMTDAFISNIYVDYPFPPSGDLIDDLNADNYMTHLHKVNVANGFRLEAIYHIGCTEAEWPDAGCYKYRQEFWFFSDGTFRPWIQIEGPGFTYNDSNCLNCDWGDPIYEVRWRINTSIAGSSDDGVRYWSSSWSSSGLLTESSKSDVSPYDPTGNEWKVFDFPESGTGTNEGFYIDPFPPDAAKWWSLHRVLSSQGTPPGEKYIPICGGSITTNCDNPITQVKGSPAFFDNNEVLQSSTAGQDNVHWYVARSFWTGGACSPTNVCYPGGEWIAKDFP